MSGIDTKIYRLKKEDKNFIYLYLPQNIFNEKRFPLDITKTLRINIEGEKLIIEQILDEAHAKGFSKDQAYGLIDGFLDGLNAEGFFNEVNNAGGDSGVLIREGRGELLEHLDDVYEDYTDHSHTDGDVKDLPKEHSSDTEHSTQTVALEDVDTDDVQDLDTDSVPQIEEGDLETVGEDVELDQSEKSEAMTS